MNSGQYEKVIDSLVLFIERASKKDATPEEIKALPEVAKVLFSCARDF